MNLHELHTPHPLRDSDFAAIRARVKAELAPRTSWVAIFARLAFAAALLVVFVPITQERRANVPVVVHSGPPASSPAVVAASRAATPGGRRKAATKQRDAARTAGETPAVQQHAQAERIEILTEDPTIRIIWLTPKENS